MKKFKINWDLYNRKRKHRYSPESRKLFHRTYKKLAEDVANISIDYNIHPFNIRSFYKLPTQQRRYCLSLIRNRIKK